MMSEGSETRDKLAKSRVRSWLLIPGAAAILLALNFIADLRRTPHEPGVNAKDYILAALMGAIAGAVVCVTSRCTDPRWQWLVLLLSLAIAVALVIFISLEFRLG